VINKHAHKHTKRLVIDLNPLFIEFFLGAFLILLVARIDWSRKGRLALVKESLGLEIIGIYILKSL